MNMVYTLRTPAGGVTISTAITILQLKAGAAAKVELLRASLTQRGSVTSVQEAVQLLRKTAAATVTAGVAGTTYLKNDPASPTGTLSLGTSASGYTGSAEGTDGDILKDEGFNVLNGWLWLPTPEERIWVPAGGIVALKFASAPASQSWRAEFVFREYQ